MHINQVEVYGVIYKITNKINGKTYIGQTTVGFDQRYAYNLARRTHNQYLKKSIEKYGIENFEIIKVFDIALSPFELNMKEIYYISKFDSINNGYNQNEGGVKNSGHGEFNPSSRKVICLNDRKIYSTLRDASKVYNIKDATKISACCRNKCKSCGKLEDGTRLVFMYLEEYTLLTEKDILERIKNANTTSGWKRPEHSKRMKGKGNPNTPFYKVVDLEGNMRIMCGNEIYNKESKGFLDIPLESFNKYVKPYGKIDISLIKQDGRTKKMIEKLKQFDGWIITKADNSQQSR